MNGKWRFWIDRGGTFTDVVAAAPDGALRAAKALSDSGGGGQDAGLGVVREMLSLPPAAVIPARLVAEIRVGTTVATNALLTRAGARTALAVTKGFGDALRIGYQDRPDLFALDARRPPPLFSDVAEIDERVGANGEVVIPFNQKTALAKLRALRKRGNTALAVAFVHGYQYPANEKRLAALARQAGFAHISASYEVAALMKLIPRGDTAVADAYLAAVIADYVRGLRAQLAAGVRLLFMQSGGALAAAKRFRGKDAVLSGPAGGAIGMIKSARAAGFDKIIGFDMGGTSTDVCHYAGELERALENTVAGARLFTPMLAIHTIAAGGGSIVRWTGERFTVGPQSAGANPGPACYRRGGPPTITDCNLLLGKLKARHFPPVFGKNRDQPPNEAAAARALAGLCAAVQKQSGQRIAPTDAAEGFIRIAVEQTAGAIRRISTAKGFDVRGYVINCFGGAAGQFACLVADALGASGALAHRFAGVLSAWGVGAADIGEIKSATIELPLDGAAAKIGAALNRLAAAAMDELKTGGFNIRQAKITRRVLCRYDGAQAQIAVAFGTAGAMRRAFETAHRRRFGYREPQKQIVAAVVQAEATIVTAPPQTPPPQTPPTAGRPDDALLSAEPTRFGGARPTRFYDWRRLPPRARIRAPAVIIDDHNAVVVEPGWRADLTANGDLLLTRAARAKPPPTRRRAEPALLEVFNNRFMSVAEEMGATLQSAASSVNIRERLDFSCAVFDANGRLAANAPHIPVHLGSMGDAVRAQLRLIRRRPEMLRALHNGDAFMGNSPYRGGTHLPDITVIKAVRLAGDSRSTGDNRPTDGKRGLPDCYLAARGHHADIGGVAPGSMPAASTTIFDEGTLIDCRRLTAHGVFADAAVRAALAAANPPPRNLDQNLADLKAQIAACEAGAQALQRAAAAFGAPTLIAYLAHIRKNAERAARRLIARLPEGSFCARMDDGGQIAVNIKIDRAAGRAIFDFTGTSRRRPNNFNAPRAVARAAVLYCLRVLLGGDIPLNEGLLRPVKIVIPRGCMLAPQMPDAVAAGNVETSQCIVDAVFAAFGAAAASQGTCNNFTFGFGDDHRANGANAGGANYQKQPGGGGLQYYETICGGGGASALAPGGDAIQVNMTNSRLTDPEVLEWRFPVRVEEFSIRKRSGGKGKQRGGDGAMRTIRFLKPAQANIVSSRRKVAPHGLAGGAAGKPGKNLLIRADGKTATLPPCAQIALNQGDAVTIQTPGGGGYGRKPGR